jgi:hypothetical protein
VGAVRWTCCWENRRSAAGSRGWLHQAREGTRGAVSLAYRQRDSHSSADDHGHSGVASWDAVSIS